ncbi:hypothetical protein BH10BDE1_BH10BDE1_31010 [soil metagenome]
MITCIRKGSKGDENTVEKHTCGHYVKSREVGLQEKFYQSGKIQQKDLWVQDRADGGVRQEASNSFDALIRENPRSTRSSAVSMVKAP